MDDNDPASSNRGSKKPRSPSLILATAAYAVLLPLFGFIARFFRLQQLDQYPVSTFIAFALVIAPYWFFGFGAAEPLRRILRRPFMQLGVSTLLVVPYLVISIPGGTFYWRIALAFIAIGLLTTAALQRSASPSIRSGGWWDLVVLATVGVTVDLGLWNSASFWGAPGPAIWPGGLGGFPKLIMMDLILYGYLVVKPVDGIGYDLTPHGADLRVGLREVLFYAPIVIPIGFLLGFLHFHRGLPPLSMVPAAWIFTFVFVAVPEELFFRGLVQNLLERRMGRRAALLVASILFGLSHFNKRSIFNRRYVLLAMVAGLFYGRAWRERRRLFASSITHATVDTIWSLWFR